MRLAYVCADPGVPVFGCKGCSIHVQEVIRALRELGVEVVLFALRLGGDPPPDLAEVPVHSIASAGGAEGTDRELALWSANASLRRLLESAGAFDVVYERYSLWSFAGMEHAGCRGIPGLLEVNAPLIEEQAAHRRLLNVAEALACARRAFAASRRLLAVSEEVASYLDTFPEASGRIVVVPNGVNVARFAEALRVREARPSGDRGRVAGFVGTLKPWHGTEVLVEAHARRRAADPAARLMIVGDGPERAALEGLARRLGLTGSVTFTGAVPASRVPALLGAMDIAVAPYPRMDGFYFSPLKVYEYLAAGLPVIASRVGQLRRVLDHGVNALLVEPGDPVALAEAWGQLGRDGALRERLGAAARQRVLRNHTWASVAQRILDLATDAGERPRGGGESVALEREVRA